MGKEEPEKDKEPIDKGTGVTEEDLVRIERDVRSYLESVGNYASEGALPEAVFESGERGSCFYPYLHIGKGGEKHFRIHPIGKKDSRAIYFIRKEPSNGNINFYRRITREEFVELTQD